MFRNIQPALLFIALLVILLVLAGCIGEQTTPPPGHSIFGTLDGKASYLLLHWPEGLRVMVWDDLAHGSHHNGSSSSTGDPVFHMDGGAQGPDGRGFEYVLESSDGLNGSFSIDEKAYDLDLGKLFFIRTASGKTQVEQLNVDLSGLATSNAGIEAFGNSLPAIIAFAASNEPPPIPTLPVATALPATAEPPADAGGTLTGNPALDRTAAIILSNDREARAALVQFSTAGCMFMTTLTGPPKCTEGMVEGTPLDYFPVRLPPGESQPVTPENIGPALDIEVQRLYAAYRMDPGSASESGSIGGEYGLIFESIEQAGWRVHALFHTTTEGRIVQLEYLACPIDEQGSTPAAHNAACSPEFIMERDALEIMVRPPEGGVAPEAEHEPAEVLVTVPPRMTPTPTPAVTGLLPQVTRPLYILTSEMPTSSIIGDGHGLWVLEPGSLSVKRLTPPEQHVTAAEVSPADGSVIYGTGDGEIFFLGPDGQARLIYTHPKAESGASSTIGNLSRSPNGEWLAFTAASQEFDYDSVAGGLWLMELAGETVIHLLNNRHLEPGDPDVSAVRSIVDVKYAPDGSGLLLQGGFWEYADTLLMLPIGLDPAENNIFDLDRFWRDGSWAADSRSIILSGWDMAAYSDLARVDLESMALTTLIDGESAGMLISKAQEFPEGIVFFGATVDGESSTTSTRLYRTEGAAGGPASFSPIGPDRDLCGGRPVMDIAWGPAGQLAAVTCYDGAELISLDGAVDVDLSPILEAIPGNNNYQVFWGS